jgi:Flp pilus assembly protein TadG
MRSRRSRRGSYAVEFALSLPILVLLVAGVVDLGLYLVVADGVVAATANGARSGSLMIQDDGEDPVAQAESIANDHWTNTGLPGAPTFAASLVGAAPDQMLVLNASVPFDGFFNFVTLPATIDYQYTMRVVRQPTP